MDSYASSTIFAAKKLGPLGKNQAFVAAYGLFGSCSQSRNKGMPEFPASLGAPTDLIRSSNARPSTAAFQVPKSTKDDLQWILKTVLEA